MEKPENLKGYLTFLQKEEQAIQWRLNIFNTEYATNKLKNELADIQLKIKITIEKINNSNER